MEQVIKYKAKDGGIFNSSTECQEHELLCYQVQQAMAPLGDCPEAVANGKGRLQHSPQTVMAAQAPLFGEMDSGQRTMDNAEHAESAEVNTR